MDLLRKDLETTVSLTRSIIPEPIHWGVRWSNEEYMDDVTQKNIHWVQEVITSKTGHLEGGFVGEVYEKTDKLEVEPIDSTVFAVIVYKHSAKGCVRVIGETVQNTITGPENDEQELLVFIDRDKEEKGWIYGQPRVKLFRRREEADRFLRAETVTEAESD